MDHSSTRRGIRAVALAFLTLTAILAGVGCGGGGSAGPTDPTPSDPGPSDPGPSDPGPQGPAPVGDVIYAVDLANNFLVFGSGSINVLSAKMKISGLPILKRIIGLAVRPSDGKLIGVGNDSRVYTIDPLTAQATPVGSGPFSPKIAEFFDIHFAMALEPNGQRLRLIAAESGGNWSISMTDGTAVLEESARYAARTHLAGQTPRLLGLVYPTLPDSAKQPGWCENLAYAIDADEALMLASCDPATGEWWPTGQSPETSAARTSPGDHTQVSLNGSPRDVLGDLKDLVERCGEFMKGMNSSDAPESPGEPEPSVDEDWSPETPETPPDPWWVVILGLGGNRVGTVEAVDDGPASLQASAGSARSVVINWQGVVPSEDPIQSAVFVPGGTYPASRMSAPAQPQLSVGADPEAEPSTPLAPPSDPRAQCGS